MAGGILEGAAKGTAAGSSLGLYGALAGGTLGAIGGILEGNAAKKAAASKATALKLQASRRTLQGKSQSEALLAQGGADQTSEFASMMGRGVSRNASVMDMSLDEIHNRAEFASNQALEQARLDSEAIISDASAVEQQGKDAYTSALIGVGSSILSSGGKYLEAKYGKYPIK
jgi:hypothetical protein